jgi:hypothetical protein
MLRIGVINACLFLQAVCRLLGSECSMQQGPGIYTQPVCNCKVQSKDMSKSEVWKQFNQETTRTDAESE